MKGISSRPNNIIQESESGAAGRYATANCLKPEEVIEPKFNFYQVPSTA